MGSPSAPPALLLSFLALPYGSSSRRSLFLNSKQRLQRLPSPGTGRRHVAAAAVDKLAPRPPEAGRLRWKYRLACRGSYDSGNGLPGPPPPPPSERGWVASCPSPMGCAMAVANRVPHHGGLCTKTALFWQESSVTAVAIGVIFGITNTFRPFSDDIFRYDFKEPFKLQNGWLLWAGIGLFFALVSISLTGAVMTFLNGETTQRETDSLLLLLPLIGSSNISTACLLGITGVLAPILEETVFRGFLMVSLTMWFSTPVSVLITAVVFAFAHLTPGEFPQLFVLGVALGFSYSQTRNLLTPITIHAAWNSGVILLLTFLQQQINWKSYEWLIEQRQQTQRSICPLGRFPTPVSVLITAVVFAFAHVYTRRVSPTFCACCMDMRSRSCCRHLEDPGKDGGGSCTRDEGLRPDLGENLLLAIAKADDGEAVRVVPFPKASPRKSSRPLSATSGENPRSVDWMTAALWCRFPLGGVILGGAHGLEGPEDDVFGGARGLERLVLQFCSEDGPRDDGGDGPCSVRCSLGVCQIGVGPNPGYFQSYGINPYVVATHSYGLQGAFGYWVQPMGDGRTGYLQPVWMTVV
ncbi:unnamed protein product [Triticum turgidum subsp. durum]|uniref:CAAX prenyl protease 2/Lysostaphin resistance protein A-like domain-containing protein n=1 Tax=Triticum turgidum subsp. durum TaxID=4567 RepID=A0A9R0Z6M7_TRITD|nr:unnamed protein product [Triticum turgidum subsp. durum]